MKQINTTLGLINSDQLGKVNVHEHVIIDRSQNKNIPEDFHHTEINLLVPELRAWKQAGGGAIVDSSPMGVGRNIELLNEVSRSAQIPVIVSSGFHKLSYYVKSHWVFSTSEDVIMEILDKECTKGVLVDDENPLNSKRNRTKANVLKFGIDKNGITPTLLKIIQAIAKTSINLDIPCMIHTEPGTNFKILIDSLEQVDISPKKVIMCHMGKSLDLNLHLTLAEIGFFLEFDEMVRPSPPLENIARTILDLFNKGYGNAILFAGDLARRSYWKCFDGHPGLKYLITSMEEELIDLGFSQNMLEQIWVNNPLELFV